MNKEQKILECNICQKKVKVGKYEGGKPLYWCGDHREGNQKGGK